MTKLDTDNPAILQEHEDRKIEQAVNRKLAAIMTWDTHDVEIKVQQGTVVLTGTVADTKSLEQTVLVVFTVKGVRQIENKLKIRREATSAAAGNSPTDAMEGHNQPE